MCCGTKVTNFHSSDELLQEWMLQESSKERSALLDYSTFRQEAFLSRYSRQCIWFCNLIWYRLRGCFYKQTQLEMVFLNVS